MSDVKIIGLSILNDFGIIKATELTFDSNNRLTVFKGEVGSGKTTVKRALGLTTEGSNTLEDKKLLGKVDLEAKLLDGEKNIFVGCKSNDEGSLVYSLYMIDESGNKINNPVIDGVKATPASYLKNLQTSLTWRLDELTSENSTTQRNILLELYKDALVDKGVVFDKKSPKYVGGVIDQIEKAKDKRNLFDMKRKEVGGIADDLRKKGVDLSERKILNIEKLKNLEQDSASLKAKKQIAIENPKLEFENKSNEIKLEGKDIAEKIRIKNDAIKKLNQEIDEKIKTRESKVKEINEKVDSLEVDLKDINFVESFVLRNWIGDLRDNIIYPEEIKDVKLKEFDFNDTGSCISKEEDFDDDECKGLVLSYKSLALKYQILKKNYEEKELDTDEIDAEISSKENEIESLKRYHKDCLAVNSFHDWKEQNEAVRDLKKDYFKLLTGMDTGVEGLYISPEYSIVDDEKIADGEDIFLMYDGSYDVDYFSNKDKELRKLSAYSDTQKPMICLLIQSYLLKKKIKKLPYLWIDKVPIDNKTKALLEKMSEDLGLWLFVNWTGDFNEKDLKNGEVLIENGEIFFKK